MFAILRFWSPSTVLEYLIWNCKKVFFDFAPKCWSRGVVYFDQLSGAGCTRKLAKTLFSAVFNLFSSFKTFFSEFPYEITEKVYTKRFISSAFSPKTQLCLILCWIFPKFFLFIFLLKIFVQKNLKEHILTSIWSL